MKEVQTDWEKVLRDKLYEAEIATHPDDWEVIASRFPAPPATVRPLYRRYGMWAAAAVALCLLMSGLYMAMHTEQGSSQEIASVVEKEKQPVTETSEQMAATAHITPDDNALTTKTANTAKAVNSSGKQARRTVSASQTTTTMAA